MAILQVPPDRKQLLLLWPCCRRGFELTLALKHDIQKATAGKHHFKNTKQRRKRKTFHAGGGARRVPGTRRVPGSWGMKENSRRRRFYILFDLDPRNLFFSYFCIHRFEVKGTWYENLVTAGRLGEATWLEHLFGCDGVKVAHCRLPASNASRSGGPCA